MNNRQNREHTRLRIVAAALGLAAVLSACVSVGYAVKSLLPEIPAFFGVLVSLWFGIVILCLLGWLIHFATQHHLNEIRREPWAQIIDAMERISLGDFSILIPQAEDDHFNELKRAVNEMAKNLGSLESMRQDFISNVSHEIQSPLTGISGFAALLEKDSISDEERRHYAEIIKSESKRLSSLSENLLKLSTLDNNRTELNKTVFRLDKQIRQIILTLEPQWAAKNITPSADLPPCEITADADLLSQVWMNLLVNAIKFTPSGGAITVSVADADAVSVEISDTGIGISPDDQIHIFERFYKVDKARDRSLGGNGLGLSIALRIVELHGGKITVRSEAGKGTTFFVSLIK